DWQYLVLVPSQLYTGVPEKACVMLNHLNETVTLNIILEYGMQARTLLADLVTEKNSFYCSPFTLPELPSSSGLITVEVKGPTQQFIKRKTVHIMKVDSLVFVQTDKPIYKPGQTVRFRVVSVDVNFHPLNETNPKRNRIFQWQNLRLQGGLSQLSFPLSVEPTLGTYKVKLQKESGEKTEHPFEVNEYGKNSACVQDIYDIRVFKSLRVFFLKDFIYLFDRDRDSQYTYGKPVSGLVTINVCRKYSRYHSACHGRHSQSICEEFSQQVYGNHSPQDTNTRSCFLTDNNAIKNIIQKNTMLYSEKSTTELELTGHGSCEITNTLSKLKFIKADTHYRHGLPFFGQVLLVDEKDQPIPNKTVVVSVDVTAYHSSLTTNEHGLVNISIDTTNFTSSVTYKENNLCFDNWWLEEFHMRAQHTVKHIFSPSKSYVHLEIVAGTMACGQIQNIRAHYILNGQILKDEKELTFYYLIKARGSISQSGIHVLSIEQGDMKGVFSFSFRVDSDIAPAAQLLVYAILPNGEIVADTEKLEIENCFANKVSLSFSSAQSLPASHNNLEVTATPHSLCALRAVDQSVLLMKPEAELSPQSVSPLSVSHVTKCTREKTSLRNWRLFTLGPSYCPATVPSLAHGVGGSVYPMLQGGSSPVVEVKETIRKYFPETWIWDLVPLDLSGRSELAVTVPDTITEWKASALCLSGTTGLGLSPVISLQAFQPFFLELTLPYSVVRGEAFTLKATVFNYLSHCIRVRLEVFPDKSADLVKNNEETPCVCGNRQKTMSWAVTPKSLGKINFTATVEALLSQELCGDEVPKVPAFGQKDTVIKPLLVEPEGIEKEEAFNTLLCASGKNPSSDFFNVFHSPGDILGSAMQNLQNLLQMPYGCGEQNMVLFVPNIYVLNYLNETRQLTETVKAKAISYLISGYQRQLNYKHSDGSYSTFGDHDGRSQGNTWLTAFVLKSFAQAQSHIFVETSHITNALTWLSRRQMENGCFQRSGSLLNNAIKGGVGDELTLSAYITIALLEMPLPHPVVRNALFCLESAWGSISEAQGSLVYTKALLAYAFALAGNQPKRSELLESLDKDAVKEDNSVHWERPQKPRAPVEHFYQPPAPSAEVEMTSYVLLAYLTAQPAPTSEELTSAARIVKWITKQQNSQGGFSSTQDTVVALQALSRYGAATFTRTGKPTQVTIQNSGAFVTNFQVDDNNRLLLHQVSLPELPGEYSITVTGDRCVYLQTSMKYNTLPEMEDSPFALKVRTAPHTCDGPKVHTSFQISLNVSYTGSRPVSNMVIVDVKMVSGFIPLKPTVKMLKRSSHVSRMEVSNNHVLIYLEQVTNQTLSFSFMVLQDIPVRDLKPATVKVYDYHETNESAIAEYIAPCSTGKRSHAKTTIFPH
uniref:Pregnancy zone protein-like n=1 Tax=Ailuropoda melanoleuca TaxID=9646 RepID=A0A7N5P1K9_AILME